MTDLFGTDLPVEGGKGGEFAWRDGPLLAALKAGHWIVLDEVNSALGDINNIECSRKANLVIWLVELMPLSADDISSWRQVMVRLC